MYISAHQESLAASFINLTVQSNVKCFKSAFKINPPDSPSFQNLGLFGLRSTSVSFVLIVTYVCVYTYMCVCVRVRMCFSVVSACHDAEEVLSRRPMSSSPPLLIGGRAYFSVRGKENAQLIRRLRKLTKKNSEDVIKNVHHWKRKKKSSR